MSRSTYYWLAAVALTVVGVLALNAYLVTRGARPSLADFLASELDSLPDDRLRADLDQLPALGDAGLAALVSAMGHPRDSVASAAYDALEATLAHWREVPAAESSPKVALLARLLAKKVEALVPEGRRHAAALAEQLLEWPIDSQAINGTRLVADCETVLRAASENVRVARSDFDPRRREPRISSPERARATPGGDLPVDPAEAPSALLPEVRSPLRPVPGPRPPLERELVPPDAPAKKPAEPERFEPPIAPRLPRPASLLPQGTGAEAGKVDGASFLEPEADSLPLSLLTDFAVMQALSGNDPLRARSASAELKRRGYSTRQLELARRATDPDPEVRRELCDTLARSGAEAKPWLRQLARDPEPKVRMAAIAVLATSGDTETQNFLRSLGLSETDPDVRALLDRIR